MGILREEFTFRRSCPLQPQSAVSILVAFEPLRELLLLLLLPLLLWLYSLQLAVPHEVDEAALLRYDTLHSIGEIDGRLALLSIHRR